jgi:crotonobetainyl-CoA:carnitine CoA-transferase CaiB-like acyl-CoA transferase
MEWAALCQAVDRLDLIEDGRFRRQRDRGLNRAAINAELADAFLNRTTAEWLVILRRFDANFAPVNRPQTIHLDPNIQASGAIADLLHPTAGPYRQPRHPAEFSETPAAIGRHAPRLGEHTAEVLAEFGTGGA